MNPEACTLVLQSFQLLKQAGELLQQFEEELRQEGVGRVTSALAGDGIDNALDMRSQTWSNGYGALRFFRANWAHTIPEANIMLAYFQDMDADRCSQRIKLHNEGASILTDPPLSNQQCLKSARNT